MTTEIFTRNPVTGEVAVKTLANIILTDMKVANYTAAPNEVVLANQVNAFTVTAPLDPEEGTLFGVSVRPNTARMRITIDPNGEQFSNIYGNKTELHLQGPQTLIFKFTNFNSQGWVPVYSVNVNDPLAEADTSFLEVSAATGPTVVFSYDTLRNGASIRWKVIADCHDTDDGNDDTAMFELLASFYRDGSDVVTQRHVRFQVDDKDTGLADTLLDFNISGQTIELRMTQPVGLELDWKFKVVVVEHELIPE